MSKYRVLSHDELESMEEDFIKFLVLNGIVADDWTKLKNEDSESAQGIISSFSDVVFEKILRKTTYIEFIDETNILCIHCLQEKMTLVGAKSDGTVNFRTMDPSTIAGDGVKVFTTEKSYKMDRQLEIFNMLQSGYQISQGDLYKKLCLVL